MSPWVRAFREPRALDTGIVLLVVITLPLEFTKEWFPVTWIETARVIMGLGLIRLAFLGLSGRWQRIPVAVSVSVVLVVVVSVASWLTTQWPRGALDATAVVIYACFALYVAQVIRTTGQVALVGSALVLGALYVAAVALLQEMVGFYIWHGEDLSVLGHRNGTFRDPHIMARHQLIGLSSLLALVGAAATASFSRRWLLAAGIIAAVIGVGEALTLSRFGTVLSIALIIGWSVTLPRRPSVGIVLLGFVIGVVAISMTVPSAQSRIGQIPDLVEALPTPSAPPAAPTVPVAPASSEVARPEATTVVDPLVDRLPLDITRRYLIRAGFAIFEDHPVVGVGLAGGQPMILGPYRNFIPPDRRAAPASLIHTEVVRIAAETGAVGLAVFAALCASAGSQLVVAWRGASGSQRFGVLGVTSALMVILLASQAEGRFYNEPYLWVLLGLLANPITWRVARSRSDPVGREV